MPGFPTGEEASICLLQTVPSEGFVLLPPTHGQPPGDSYTSSRSAIRRLPNLGIRSGCWKRTCHLMRSSGLLPQATMALSPDPVVALGPFDRRHGHKRGKGRLQEPASVLSGLPHLHGKGEPPASAPRINDDVATWRWVADGNPRPANPSHHTHTLPPATPKAAAPTSTPERPSTVARLLPNNRPIRPGFAAPRRCEWTGTPHRHPGAGLSWVDDINPGEVSALGHACPCQVALVGGAAGVGLLSEKLAGIPCCNLTKTVSSRLTLRSPAPEVQLNELQVRPTIHRRHTWPDLGWLPGSPRSLAVEHADGMVMKPSLPESRKSDVKYGPGTDPRLISHGRGSAKRTCLNRASDVRVKPPARYPYCIWMLSICVELPRASPPPGAYQSGPSTQSRHLVYHPTSLPEYSRSRTLSLRASTSTQVLDHTGLRTDRFRGEWHHAWASPMVKWAPRNGTDMFGMPFTYSSTFTRFQSNYSR
ncbi:hypothetical protein BKA56DRAFT_614955 [Ilyonectria sp. MPI-CAGE-AT-0026]|nr:hypothetical protein BKA56DRAFT_614955 [Ilyonectria sp. MPI-CAGE-AT-0026]